MKEFFKKLKDWFFTSNHYQHFVAGVLVYFFTFCVADILFNFMLGTKDIVSSSQVADTIMNFYGFFSLYVSFIAMCSVEFIQFKIYGKPGWDWQDILAGCLPGLLMTFLVLIL